MLGMLLTFAACAAATALAACVLGRRLPRLDPAERVGVCGLLGLGAVGWVTFFLGVIPGGLRWTPWAVWATVAVLGTGCVLTGIKKAQGKVPWPTLPQGAALAFPAALSLMALIPVVNALAPSDGMDWDTLAYHLAVPKLWLAAGQIEYVPFIHHSNFPFVVDNLYILGLGWGGESGAKAFTVAFLVLGMVALFGLARRWFGGLAGWWSALALAGMPVVLWESGSGYIDVAHGLFAGLCVLYAASFAASARHTASDRLPDLMIAAAMGGLASASKYTGLQAAGAAAMILVVALLWGRNAEPPLARRLWSALGSSALILAAAVAIASPWLARNVVNTGNPVYPFFYERLGGRHWDAWRAAIYRDEQQTFGVGRTESGRDPAAIAHAILGLGYQPGRFVNPGQTEGNGFPMGAVGIVGLLGALAWLTGGKKDARVGWALAMVGVMFLAWFFLSQQSRYAVSMMVPVCVLVGGAVARLPSAPVLRGIVALQAAYSTWMLYTVQTGHQLLAVTGRVSRDDYLSAREPFYEQSKRINEAVKAGKVALYDQVFGYYLDVPYFWANPGHCTLIPYERLEDGASLVQALRDLGITHVYLDLRYQTTEQRDLFVQAAHQTLSGSPYEPENRARMMQDLNLRWKVLLTEAMAEGRFEPVSVSRGGILARIRG